MPKTTTKKPTARTTTATKAKKTTTRKKTVAASVKAPGTVSFRLCDEQQPFMTTKPSIQSLYWLIIGVLALVFVAWAMVLTAQVQAIYDTIIVSDSTSYTVTK